MTRKQKSSSLKDAWGHRLGTGTAAINAVLLKANYPLTEQKIAARITECGLKKRDAIGEHLRSLKRRGLVIKTPNGFIRTGDWLLAKDAEQTPSSVEVESYTPDNVDRRQIVQRQIRARRGQQQFREALLREHGCIHLRGGTY